MADYPCLDALAGHFFRYNLRMIPLSGDEYADLGGHPLVPRELVRLTLDNDELSRTEEGPCSRLLGVETALSDLWISLSLVRENVRKYPAGAQTTESGAISLLTLKPILRTIKSTSELPIITNFKKTSVMSLSKVE